MCPLDESLIVNTLKQGVPILCGLSATYLYQECRERWQPRDEAGKTSVADDVGGDPSGHFVVLHGIDPNSGNVLIADPLYPNPFAHDSQVPCPAFSRHVCHSAWHRDVRFQSPNPCASRRTRKEHSMKVILVVESRDDWIRGIEGIQLVDPSDYLANPLWEGCRGTRVYNLCRSYSYQSMGYYVSLLAEARGQRPIPDVMTIQDLCGVAATRLIPQTLDELVQKSLHSLTTDDFMLSVYFGENLAKKYERLSKELYGSVSGTVAADSSSLDATTNGVCAVRPRSHLVMCRYHIANLSKPPRTPLRAAYACPPKTPVNSL